MSALQALRMVEGSGAALVLALYYLVLGVLALFGVHRMALVVGYWRRRHADLPVPDAPAVWPIVTVQLPIYNEMYVVKRLLDAVARLDYPAARLEIQVLDDSTDETSAIAAATVERLRRGGLNVQHLRRRARDGFKAGALAAGLERAAGELIAVFDADFVPPPAFLKDSVPYFVDPSVGMVQARWEHLNREYSLLTRVQAMLLDGHFVIEHTARHRGGYFFNFNGTAGVWRRRAIVEAGGWQHDTLTEDLDLSYRAQLAGWRFLYLPDLVVPAELPVTVHAFKSQQRRWAKGAMQTARKLLPRILRADLPWRVRLEAAVHLTNNASYPLMVLLSLLVLPTMVLGGVNPVPTWRLVDLALLLSATVSVLAFYFVSQTRDGRSPWRSVCTLPALMALSIGLAVNNSRAVLAGLWQRGGVFDRTPKYALRDAGESWRRKHYQLGIDGWLAGEGALALLMAAASAAAFGSGLWLSLPFLYLFLQGYATMFALSVAALPLPKRIAG